MSSMQARDIIQDPAGFMLPPEIYVPCTTPGYVPMNQGATPADLNLVVEGGALRGIFAAGVMDFLMEKGVWAKNLIGVSAGTLCGFNYVSGEHGRTCYVNVRFCNDWRYLSLQSFVATGNAYGVKFAFHDVPERYCPVDDEAFMASPTKLHAVVTNLKTGHAEYHVMRNFTDDWPIARASSAMPFVSQTVNLNGQPYLDGGVADSIPLDYSLQLGAKKHLILLTQDRNFIKPPSHMADFGQIFYRDYPNFVQAMANRTDVYNATREKVFSMHKSGEVYAIWPQTRPTVTHMETNRCKVFDLWLEGWLEAQKQWPAIKEYLEL